MTTAARSTGLHPSTHFPAPTRALRRRRPSIVASRDGVRLLVARTPSDVRHRVFRDLPDELEPGDLVVVNTSATIAAESDASSTARGPVVVHVATHLDDGTWVVEVRTAPDAERAILDAEPGEVVALDGATVTLVAPYPRARLLPDRPGNRLWRPAVERPTSPEDHLALHGRPISYGYLADAIPLPPTTRRSSPSDPGAPRCPARPGRSPPSSSRA